MGGNIGDGESGASDIWIKRRLLEDDQVAFGVLFDRYARLVFRVCWRGVYDQPAAEWLAEDMMSLTFLSAWSARSRAVLVDDSLRPWLVGVASNVVRNQRRAARRHAAAMRRAPVQHRSDDFADEACGRVDAEGDLARVLSAFDTLSRRERQVADLCLLEGLEPAAVGRLLGVPEGTVKSRLARARDRLRSAQTGDITDRAPRRGHLQGGTQERVPATGEPT